MGQISSSLARALGKLLANVRNPQWVSKQVTSQVVNGVIVNPVGQKINSWFHHGDVEDENRNKIAHVLRCDNGHEYIYAHGKTYFYHQDSDSFTEIK